ncbi:MAG: 16S rRNA (guanine(527)-N(7))-methyltransferase RsmG [Burkholderiaceae bacterium]|nr:16S rRNA (guanine(527)-N(7))-methyltransferase RsmG [Burkholderiaceae bacterium]
MVQPVDHHQRLSLAADELSISLTQHQSKLLLEYLAQMQRWNRSYNLTALKDPEQMLIQHVFDSMAVEPIFRNVLYKNTVSSPLIVDVGSGAGLPGVVLAILHPEWRVLCIDAVEKKTAFIRHMVSVLGLSNLDASHARVEALEPLQADIVVSRAFASLVDFATLAGRHIAPEGQLLAMKGRQPDDEIAILHAQTPWQVNHIYPLTVPELHAQRCLLSLNCQGNP